MPPYIGHLVVVTSSHMMLNIAGCQDGHLDYIDQLIGISMVIIWFQHNRAAVQIFIVGDGAIVCMYVLIQRSFSPAPFFLGGRSLTCQPNLPIAAVSADSERKPLGWGIHSTTHNGGSCFANCPETRQGHKAWM